MAGEIAIIAKAKADLEAAGVVFTTDCDAYRITNLAAQRTPGWKVIEKLSGVQCQSRKVDGIIANGMAYDCLVGGGPPANANTPAWQELGPQNALVAKDPYPWPDPAEHPGPDPGPDPEPEPEPDGDDATIIAKLDTQTKLLLIMDAKLDMLAIQADNNTQRLSEQIHQVVEDMEASLGKYMPVLIALLKAADDDNSGIGPAMEWLTSRRKP